jgi:hypothetical protein
MRRVIALGVLVAALAGGCSSSSHHASSPSTTAAVNPDAVPGVITPAYVDSVFVVLNHVYSESARQLRVADGVTTQIKAEVRAVFNDPVYARQLEAAQQALQQRQITNVRPNGGDARTVVVRLITATTACIFAETSTDLSALVVHAGPPAGSEYYELAPKQGADPQHFNPTPWAISLDEAFRAPTNIASPCASS